uniref:Uncharacterized protein n=1 Tax=Micrurus lemniscatus lemniscatus TaxID=129467 RepID=A0A2D4IZ72_MICLE
MPPITSAILNPQAQEFLPLQHIDSGVQHGSTTHLQETPPVYAGRDNDLLIKYSKSNRVPSTKHTLQSQRDAHEDTIQSDGLPPQRCNRESSPRCSRLDLSASSVYKFNDKPGRDYCSVFDT